MESPDSLTVEELEQDQHNYCLLTVTPLPPDHEYEVRNYAHSATAATASAAAAESSSLISLRVDVDLEDGSSDGDGANANYSFPNDSQRPEQIKNNSMDPMICSPPLPLQERDSGIGMGVGMEMDCLLDHHYFFNPNSTSTDEVDPFNNPSSLQELLEAILGTGDRIPGLEETIQLEPQEIIPYEQHVLNMLDEDLVDERNADEEVPVPGNVIETTTTKAKTGINSDTETDDEDYPMMDSDSEMQLQNGEMELISGTGAKAKAAIGVHTHLNSGKKKGKRSEFNLEKGIQEILEKVQRIRQRTGAKVEFRHNAKKLGIGKGAQLRNGPISTGYDLNLDTPENETADDHNYAAIIVTQRIESPTVRDHQYNDVSTTTGIGLQLAPDIADVETESRESGMSPSPAPLAYFTRQYERDKCLGSGIPAIFKKIDQVENKYTQITKQTNTKLKFHLTVHYEGFKFTRANYKTITEVLKQKRNTKRGHVKRLTHVDFENDPEVKSNPSDLQLTTFSIPVRKMKSMKSAGAEISTCQITDEIINITVPLPVVPGNPDAPGPICTLCLKSNSDLLLLTCSIPSCKNSVHCRCLGFKLIGGTEQLALLPPYFCPDHR